MRTRESVRWTTTMLAAALWLAAAQSAWASSIATDTRSFDGVRVQLDNDLFAAGGGHDRDYTGGMALTISGERARDGWLSLDPLLRRMDEALLPGHSQSVYYARQFGLMAFSPEDITSTQPLYDERPYASLLFTSNGRVSVDANGRGAWFSSLTVGVLGLRAVGELHSDVHEWIGSDPVRGYDNQISAGGEPTARYTLARQRLWIANPAGTLDVKTTVQGSVGFLTETSVAVSMRVGRLDSPWWSLAPELTDYIGAPLPVATQPGRPEMYFFTGLRVKARAYNAFLQGQFRDSPVRYSYSETEPLVAEAWVGFVTQIFHHTQLSYTLNYQTAELREGKAARDALWGGVQFSHSF